MHTIYPLLPPIPPTKRREIGIEVEGEREGNRDDIREGDIIRTKTVNHRVDGTKRRDRMIHIMEDIVDILAMHNMVEGLMGTAIVIISKVEGLGYPLHRQIMD